MALRWIEGWEAVTAKTGLERLYTYTGGALAAEAGANDPLQSAVSSDEAVLTTPVLTSPVQNSWIIGVAFRSDSISTIDEGSIPYVALGNTDGEQIRLEFLEWSPSSAKPGGVYYRIRAMRGATILATSDMKWPLAPASAESWIFFEFKVTIDNSVGSIAGRFTYMTKQNLNPSGAPTVLTWDNSVTSIDTQNQTSAGADRFTVSFDTGNGGDAVAFDDIYVMDSTGSVNNDWVGKIIVEPQSIPSAGGGDGNTVDWDLTGGATSTEDAWQDTLVVVNDDKRVISDVTSEVHLAVVDPLKNALNSTIVGVRQDAHIRMETTGDLDIAHRYRKTTATPAETTAGPNRNVTSTTVVGDAHVTELDPNTSLAWVVADLNSYEHGVINNG